MNQIGESEVPGLCLQLANGVDLVSIPQLSKQLQLPGSQFRRVFSDREWRYCQGRPDPFASLAGCWAGKEAAVKAWSARYFGSPPPVDPEQLNWAEIEVVHDRWFRPALRFSGEVARVMEMDPALAGANWSISLSHEGDYALAQVVLYYRWSADI